MQEKILKFHKSVKKKAKTDEYITPDKAVELLIPFIPKNLTIWCPFDLDDSPYVRILKENGFLVVNSHIEKGQDFFSYEPDTWDIIVSNPPFSKRNDILMRCYELGKPFMLLLNASGIFDNKNRFAKFAEKGIQFLIPHGRIKYIARDGSKTVSPMFQSIYVCNKILLKDISFEKDIV